jgi:hypothetical protein
VKITHEGVNSFGIIASFVIGTTALAMQCTPKPENVTLDRAEVAWPNEPMQMRITTKLRPKGMTFLGPIYWQITFTNHSDRPVSFKSAKVVREDDREIPIARDDGLEGIFLQDRVTPALPFTLQAYEVKPVFLKGYLPSWITVSTQKECSTPNTTLSDFQWCALFRGSDIFGNKMTIEKGGVLRPRYSGAGHFPRLLLKFTSGENKEYQTTASLDWRDFR